MSAVSSGRYQGHITALITASGNLFRNRKSLAYRMKLSLAANWLKLLKLVIGYYSPADN